MASQLQQVFSTQAVCTHHSALLCLVGRNCRNTPRASTENLLREEIIGEKRMESKEAEKPKFLGKTSAGPEDFLLVEVSSCAAW